MGEEDCKLRGRVSHGGSEGTEEETNGVAGERGELLDLWPKHPSERNASAVENPNACPDGAIDFIFGVVLIVDYSHEKLEKMAIEDFISCSVIVPRF